MFVIDDVDWENEGDVILVVEFVDLCWVGWMVCYIFGYLCVFMIEERVD